MAPSAVRCCFRLLRWIPVLFITVVISWSYYAYAIRMCFVLEPGPTVGEKVIYLVLYHPILILFLWAYFKTIFAEPAAVPIEFFLNDQALQSLQQARSEVERTAALEQFAREQELPITCRNVEKEMRYCEKCKCIKPDRAHHCSVCGVCILKMDHHCPWVNNCVNFSSYKYFVLFLIYAETYCIYIAATDLQFFIGFWGGVTNTGNDFHVMFVFIIAMMFGLSLMGLLGYHLFLISRNRSTLETFRTPIFYHYGPDKSGFNVGTKRNFRDIFGDRPFLWLLPIWSSRGDGVSFATRNSMHRATYNTMTDDTIIHCDVDAQDKLHWAEEGNLGRG